MADQIIRVVCSLEGHEDDWIEFDTSAWGLAEYREMFYSPLPTMLRQWVERDSVAWHLTGQGGANVPHPGRRAVEARWLAAYRQLGEEGLKLARWLAFSALSAVYERMEPPKKSPAGGATDGTGGDGPGAAGDAGGAPG